MELSFEQGLVVAFLVEKGMERGVLKFIMRQEETVSEEGAEKVVPSFVDVETEVFDAVRNSLLNYEGTIPLFPDGIPAEAFENVRQIMCHPLMFSMNLP